MPHHFSSVEYGDPRLPGRFWGKVYPEPNTGCWLWGGTASNGYGYVSFGRKTRSIHRLVFETLVGPIPAGLVIDHECNTRRCCNPGDLTPKTGRENTLRGAGSAARRAKQTECLRGHPLTGPNAEVYLNGRSRQCRVCVREYTRRDDVKAARLAKARAKQVPRIPKSHCPQGHPFDEVNTYAYRDGFQRCRECRKDASRRHYVVKRVNRKPAA